MVELPGWKDGGESFAGIKIMVRKKNSMRLFLSSLKMGCDIRQFGAEDG